MTLRWQTLRSSWPTWLAAIAVVALALKVTIGLDGTFDVFFDDEAIYLDGARHLGDRFLPLAESSPLYPLWYRALGLFQPDPLKLYFLGWFVLTAALPIVLYALARRSGAPLFAAVAVASVWALSSAATTWPFVSKFATLVLALGALASTYARDARVGVALSAAALSAAAFARPELALPAAGFALTILVWCLVGLRRSRGGRRRRAAAVGGLATIAAPLALRAVFGKVGNPFAYGRQFFAFGQHYALNVVEDRQLPLDPWTSWLPIARESFPTAGSIADAARENPAAFAWHVKRNASLLPDAVHALLKPLPHEPGVIRAAALVALVVTLVFAASAVATRRAPRLPAPLVRWTPLLLAMGLATGASSILVYPRQHYILPLTFFALAAVAAAAGHPRGASALAATRPGRWSRSAVALFAALLVAAVPTARPGALPSLFAALGPPPAPESAQENRATIHALRKLSLVSLPWGPVAPREAWMPTVVLLEPDYSRGVFAFHDFVRVEQWRKTTPFWQFVRDTWTNVIVLNARLLNDGHLRDDPDFVAFVDGTGEREDFEMYPVEGTSVVLAVRRSLLQFASVQPNR
ncbi:MAG: hypothetical protein KF795_32350 [Labilithrix sp.]|nr:hypothetical protein [Labilithrix sp.]